jgi:hypothetical protein
LDEKTLLGELEALALRLEVNIRYESFEEDPFSPGGICRIRGKPVIILNNAASSGEKCQTLAKALRRFDLNGLYLKPALRELLEEPESEE